MRNSSQLYCFNKSHILEREILSKTIDHAHQPMLRNFCLGRGIRRGITSLGYYIRTTRFSEPTPYKRRVLVHSSSCFKH